MTGPSSPVGRRRRRSLAALLALLALLAGCLPPSARPLAEEPILSQYTMFLYRLYPRVDAAPMERIPMQDGTVRLQSVLRDPRLLPFIGTRRVFLRGRALARFVLKDPLPSGEVGTAFVLYRVKPAGETYYLCQEGTSRGDPRLGDRVIRVWLHHRESPAAAVADARDWLLQVFARGEFDAPAD